MGYVVVVFAIINSAALIGMAVLLFYITRDMPTWVEAAIADAIRKQDDRIEKRLSRAADPAATDQGQPSTAVDGMRAGQPWRR